MSGEVRKVFDNVFSTQVVVSGANVTSIAYYIANFNANISVQLETTSAGAGESSVDYMVCNTYDGTFIAATELIAASTKTGGIDSDGKICGGTSGIFGVYIKFRVHATVADTTVTLNASVS